MRPCWRLLVKALLLGLFTAFPAMADDATVESIAIHPPSVSLQTAGAEQRIVIQAIMSDGITRDVTDEATLEFSEDGIASLDNAVLQPTLDGETILRAEYQGKRAESRIVVGDSMTLAPVRFRMDVMPVLNKAGCNSGSCHGSARGQDGFHLSLFGYDPAGDYYTLTRELPGRRIDRALPEESLLLKKAINAVAHTGGERFTRNSRAYRLLAAWIRSGAADDAGQSPAVSALTIAPTEIAMVEGNATHRLVATATYADGSQRDVSSTAVYISNNDRTASVSPDGVVTAGVPGEALILARFDTFTVGVSVIVVPEGMDDPGPPVAPANYIDELIGAKLRKLRIRPTDICDDATFLRRVSIDITGRLPTAEQFEAFEKDADQSKRARLVDELLQKKEFVEIWVMKWAHRLGIRSTILVSQKAALLYHGWLQERLANEVPINQLVGELIGATGGTFTNPATNFYQLEQSPLKLSENVAQAFLGVRVQCAQCHNHPFDRWTMNDYYGFAAFFSQIGRKSGEDPREMVIFNSNDGEVRHPVGNRVMAPKFLGDAAPDLHGRDRRQALAEWLSDANNRMFARNAANFAWSHFFGRGIVEPIDDFRVSNPPANGPLLEALADHLIEYHHDLRRLVRDICLSNAYQRSIPSTSLGIAAEANFAHAIVRSLPAETLLDCISQATGAPHKYAGLPLGARATQIADASVSNYFLTTFGRVQISENCICPAPPEPSLSQALHLISGDTINDKIKTGGLIESWTAQGATPEQIVTRLYVRCLSRAPTPHELDAVTGLLNTSADVKPALFDLFWAILNSKEFIFNH
ncbi:MAG: DUF1549 domain-containing protein [Phycisphaerales bacterium]|nr:DUF1549 domain-containing protein [Phycisphaerales bacterium]MCB9854546.1 DUF1549 domain-containing protein [Phycisphaerales bacterium]MCB9863201.1 DUF1549 domain-containing protein [Phycisphaerales bacterium]